ncbi:hypothetical protein [Streptomyces caelestis]|uniref:hypothetical protein n=1 Tax=Streptomyces caelestis TaxID=36816 RepID=UPI00364E492B
MGEHAAGEVMVHDAPLVQAVHMVLEAAAEEEEPVSAELLRAAADVLDRLVGASHIDNLAIHGVRAGGWLTEPRMVERIYTTTAPGRGRRGGGPAHDARGRPLRAGGAWSPARRNPG